MRTMRTMRTPIQSAQESPTAQPSRRRRLCFAPACHRVASRPDMRCAAPHLHRLACMLAYLACPCPCRPRPHAHAHVH
eukprot:6126705-Prymnesium_polylepis.1